MDAINSLPVTAPVAAVQGPRAEAASEHDSQSASFENLLEEKSALAGEPAAVGWIAPRPDEQAKAAGQIEVPDTADFSTLVAMIPVLPIPPTLPLQPEPLAPAPSAEASAGTNTAASMAVTFPGPGLSLQTTAATGAVLFAPSLSLPTATPMQDVCKHAESETTTLGSNEKPSLENSLPRSTPVVIPAPLPSPVPAVESFAKAAPAPEPAAIVSETAVVVTTVPVPREVRGTDVAMQHRAMPDPLNFRASEPKTAALAADAGAPEMVATGVGPQAGIRIPASARQQHAASEHREERPGAQPQTGEAPAPSPAVANVFVAPAASPDEPAAITRTQTETIVHRTMDAAERLRVTGGERVEVQIKLDAGQALTVRLRLVHGEVQPVFLTDSHELRQALEQNWSQFAERGAERNVRVTTPVFESPNAQSGMNDLNQQQREGRQRAFAEAQEAAFAAGNPSGRMAPRRRTAAVPAAAPTTGVQLYA